jgi:hypothetical protein
MSDSDAHITVTYGCPRWLPEWAVPEVPVPESDTHDLGIEDLRSTLLAWIGRTGRNVKIARDLGIRWYRPERRAGFNPDLCLLEPPPPDAHLSSLRLWEEEHRPPWLAIEVVSPGHPYKDYVDTPERCAACGIAELWVYDPLLAGPKRSGGPFPLQIWTLDGDTMTRIHASSAPGYSPALNAWLLPGLHPMAGKMKTSFRGPELVEAPTNLAKARLRISNAQVGGDVWPTLAEVERTRTERQRARAEQEQARADELAERVDQLQRELQELKKD